MKNRAETRFLGRRNRDNVSIRVPMRETMEPADMLLQGIGAGSSRRRNFQWTL